MMQSKHNQLEDRKNVLFSSDINGYTELYMAMLAITDTLKNINQTNLNVDLAVMCGEL